MHYGSDIAPGGIVSDQWKSNKDIMKMDLTPEYKDLYGVDFNPKDTNQTTTLTFKEDNLP
jgi:hypothetical protein